MNEEIIVGMGELVVANNPAILTSLGLGSCVGVAVWCEKNHIGGLAHIMLPNAREKKNLSNNQINPSELKYADIAIPLMIQKMIQKGCNKEDIVAKIAGGAHMFPTLKLDVSDIGRKNGESVKEELKNQKIKILCEDLGGNDGRTIRFELSTGMLNIKTKNGSKEI